MACHTASPLLPIPPTQPPTPYRPLQVGVVRRGGARGMSHSSPPLYPPTQPPIPCRPVQATGGLQSYTHACVVQGFKADVILDYLEGNIHDGFAQRILG